MPKAIIDLGSNSLKVVREDSSTPLGYTQKLHVTRLSEGYRDGRLAETSIMRNLEILCREVESLRYEGIGSISVYGTEIMRSASNRKQMQESFHRITGLRLHVLSSADEALYSYLAANPDRDEYTCVFDIGGGSLEFIRDHDGKIISHSIPLGALRLSESHRYGYSSPKAAHTAMQTEAKKQISSVPLIYTACRRLVAVGGTAVSLGALNLGGYSYNELNGYQVSIDYLQTIIGNLAELSLVQIAALPGLQAGREHSILAGALICREILSFFNKDSFALSLEGWAHYLLHHEIDPVSQ